MEQCCSFDYFGWETELSRGTGGLVAPAHGATLGVNATTGLPRNVNLHHQKAGVGVSGPLTGQLLSGKWRVGELLGLGGMSSVYSATHRNGKRVAIKVLRTDRLGHSRTRRRFLREGYIANRVGHEGVVAVLDDHVSDDGTAFLIMELLEGMNVEQYCDQQGGALPPAEVLAIADAVLDILVAAHAQQIVHRDIKPSNLFLTSAGGLKLLDFGIASLREVSGLVNATGDGVVLGTPGFMAPEQARGRRNDIDERTDLWGVGALMFRLLTGRLIYETESSNEYVVAAATQHAPSLSSINPSLDKGLVELVDRALKSDAAARWQTAAEMQKAIRHECSQITDCSLPRPLPRRDAVTLEESLSVNATSNELLHGRRILPGDPARETTLRIWPFLAYGGLGGAALVAVLATIHPAATNVTLPSQAPARLPIEAKTSLAPMAPLGATDTPPLATGRSEPADPPVGTMRSGSGTPAFETMPTPRGHRSGTRLAPNIGSASAPGSSTVAPLPLRSRPKRLEDVLDERR